MTILGTRPHPVPAVPVPAGAGATVTTGGGVTWDRDAVPAAARCSAAQIAERSQRAGFGQVLTEHMVSIRWSAGRGWHDAQLRPYGALIIDPATAGLHYGQVIFEGLKAFRQPDGSAAVYRPLDHARRFQRSARRLAMPELPEELFTAAVAELVNADLAWVPSEPGRSLYLRPLLYAADSSLALRPSGSYEFLLLAFVTEGFFGDGVPSVSVWVSEEYARAARGGTGEAKCAGNYAPGYLAQAQAAEHGCQQVVWLDSAMHWWVEEMGGMNLFFVYGEGAGARLVTPPLTGTLLPGVTRSSLLTLAADLGITPEERMISVGQWRADARSGAMTEAFACGTAAGVTGVAKVVTATQSWQIGSGQAGPVSAALRDALTGVQRGGRADRHGWMHHLVPASGARQAPGLVTR